MMVVEASQTPLDTLWSFTYLGINAIITAVIGVYFYFRGLRDSGEEIRKRYIHWKDTNMGFCSENYKILNSFEREILK